MPAPEELIGGRYRLVHQLASGGMGSVWQAWDERLQRPVAVKQLLHQPGLSEQDAQLAVDRAMREARITARLHHPHAVPVYDVVEHHGRPCLIMQYVPSESLQQLLHSKGTLEPVVVAGMGAEIAAALAAAHEAGIVHRDVKPSNVLITEDGHAKLTDFGVSHAVGDVSLTSTGMLTGTPAYLAPEVARGAESVAASDVFSLGATLYAAMEGSPPFGTEDNPMAVLHRVATGVVVPPRASGALAPLLGRMLAADPAGRPPMIDVQHTLGALHSDLTAMAGVTRELPAVTPVPPVRPVARTTVRPASPPTAAPPPPPTGILPVAPERARPPRRRGGLIAALVVVLLLAAAVLTAVLLDHRGGSPQAGGQRTPASTPTLTRASTPASSSAPAASSTPASSTPAPSTKPATSSPPAKTAGRAARLAQAITDYYALLPADTDRAWARLTEKYQQGTAQSRQYYQSFWSAISQVGVSQVSAQPPGSVQATVTYHYRDGRVIVERTAYNLVDDHKELKIDGSTVLSSQTQ